MEALSFKRKLQAKRDFDSCVDYHVKEFLQNSGQNEAHLMDTALHLLAHKAIVADSTTQLLLNENTHTRSTIW